MTLDENAAAFGLFQLTFANLHQQLATVVFFLRQIEEPSLEFHEVFGLPYSSMSMQIQLLKKNHSRSGRSLDGATTEPTLVCESMKMAFEFSTGRLARRFAWTATNA